MVVSPELRAGAGGLADYTRRLVEQWPNEWNLRFLIPENSEPVDDSRVETMARNARALRQKLPRAGGRVLLQYSAYGFDRVGYPRWLLRELTNWKKNSNGLLVVMFHEIWSFWPRLNKNYFVQEMHRRALAKLVAVADVIFTSTRSQAERLNEFKPRTPVQLLPVGSNIRVTATSHSRETATAVLFGLQGSRINALRAMAADLRSLVRAKKFAKIISIGGGNSARDDDEERKLLRDLIGEDGYALRGPMAEDEISHEFMKAGFGISAQDELSLTKSGTFMAYAAHGLNVLSRLGGSDQGKPRRWLTSPEELLAGLAARELETRAENLRAWQERTASWPHIAEQFARALKLRGQPSAEALAIRE